VVARAAMLLECAHLVSRCNHGDWPRWMKMPGGEPHSRNQPSGARRNLLLQRATGRLFYQWAEVSSTVYIDLTLMTFILHKVAKGVRIALTTTLYSMHAVTQRSLTDVTCY